MVGSHHVGGLGEFGQGDVNNRAVAKMRGERGVHRIREERRVVCRTGLEAQVHKFGEHVVHGVEGGFGSGEVRVQSEGAQVGREGVVGCGGEEDLTVAEGCLGIGERGRRVWVMQGIEAQNAE